MTDSKPIVQYRWTAVTLLLLAACGGCGTSKWTDTKRTATEQLLISDSMDRAVSQLDFRALAGKKAYLDNTAITTVTDYAYLTSSLRQHMLASGCLLKDEQKEADYVVEIRAGAVGTDRHDVLYGVPAMNVPTMLPLPVSTPTIPEIPLAKKTDQRAVTKIALFAYNRNTGRPIWQSGVVPVESRAKDLWFFGAGPFQRGSIYEGTNFAGHKLNIPLIDIGDENDDQRETVSVADEAYFVEPEEELAVTDKTTPEKDAPEKESAVATKPGKPATKNSNVVKAAHETPLGETKQVAPERTPHEELPSIEFAPIEMTPLEADSDEELLRQLRGLLGS